MINRLQDTGQTVSVHDTTLALDVLGRFICDTWDEATSSGGVQFDAVVIGSGMFGAYCAEKIYRNASLRVFGARGWNRSSSRNTFRTSLASA